MDKKLTTIVIVVALLASAFIIFNQNGAINATTNNPVSLKIYVGPSSVLADNNVYNCIFIQLLDSSGQPTRALQDTTITLSSSLTNIGTVDPTITIPKNATYSTANFYTSLTPGTTTISASATGYATVQAGLTTVTPIPSAIGIYGFPSTLPADNGTYPAIMVQLQDSSGLPERAPPDGVNVTLSCSDSSVGSVSPAVVTIPYGQTYAIANFTTQPTNSTGSAIITTLANGYASRQLTITTESVTTNLADPKYLKIFVGPPQILADNNSYPQIAVELQDGEGNIAETNSNVSINLISTDTTIGQVNSTLTIGPSSSQFQTYAVTSFNTTYKAGATNIVAAATDWNPDSQPISTVEFIPPKLAVYAVPSLLPSDSGTYPAIVVQLQDSQGRPAKNLEGDVSVNLFSQQPAIGTISSTLTIPSGKTQATASLNVTNVPGSTTVTAQAPGYTTGQDTVFTYLIDYQILNVTLTSSPQSTISGNTTLLTAYVNVDGNPITGATLSFSSNNGGTFSTTTEQGNGYYQANFTTASFSQSTISTITASASKTGYVSSQGTTMVTVLPAPPPTPTPSPTPTPTPSTTPTPATSNTTSSGGTLTLLILDKNNNPLNGTLVTTINEPSGMGTLVDLTNATGYVTFQNVTAGTYKFKLVDAGYPETNATIDFPGQSFTMSINLIGGNITQASSTPIMLIIAIVAVAIAAAGAGGFLLIGRGSKSRAKKINELQKQLNSKR